MSTSRTATAAKAKRVRVWDIPTRFFHWGIAGCFLVSWLTRGDRYLDIHVFSGYLMIGLLLFRLLWGFVGGPYVGLEGVWSASYRDW